MYICNKAGKTFKVKDEKAMKIYKAAGYTVTGPDEKKAAKRKAKTVETTETTETAETETAN